MRGREGSKRGKKRRRGCSCLTRASASGCLALASSHCAVLRVACFPGRGHDLTLCVPPHRRPLSQELKTAAALAASSSTPSGPILAAQNDMPAPPSKKHKLSPVLGSTARGGFGTGTGTSSAGSPKFGDVLKVVRVNMCELKRRDAYQVRCGALRARAACGAARSPEGRVETTSFGRSRLQHRNVGHCTSLTPSHSPSRGTAPLRRPERAAPHRPREAPPQGRSQHCRHDLKAEV